MKIMKATALVHGAATIVAAFATGMGGAYGLGLENKTTVKLTSSRKLSNTVNGKGGTGDRLAEFCVKKTLKHFGERYTGAAVETQTNIPVACGLKSSSVAANAIVLATAGALAKRHGEIRDVKLIKGLMEQKIQIKGREVDPLELVGIGVQAARQAKVTVTGAYDDATASFLGGITLTDNREMKLVHAGELETLKALILVPKAKAYSADVDVKRFKAFAKETGLVWDQALAGKVYHAITLNGLINSAILGQDAKAALKAMEAGAIAAGLTGKGPAVVALTRGDGKRVREAWNGLGGRIIETTTSNEKARIIE